MLILLRGDLVKRHTTVNIDSELLAAASRALETSGVTETVHAALSASVRPYWSGWMADHPVELTADDLHRIRRDGKPVAESSLKAPADAKNR